MRQRLLALLACAFALGASAASAMEFNLVGETLVLSGPVVSTDLVRMRDHLATRRVKLVLLHESPGGDLWNGYQLGVRIRDEQLPTAVSGKCESACGLVFLSGAERSFSDGRPIGKTMVGLHGAHTSGTQEVLSELGPRMAYVIKTMTARKYPPDLLDRTVYPRHADDMVYAFHPGRYPAGARGRGVLECLKQPDISFRCTMLDGLDALGIGVITNPEIIQLPAEVKQVLDQLAS
ncbi:MAG: molybdopterin biosynthesis protein MoeB [Ramlibacter sp.]|nr:molybdopterin biosynthesis protein MoeB [Ramlibacter sp.]